jgi:hypothetical protein
VHLRIAESVGDQQQRAAVEHGDRRRCRQHAAIEGGPARVRIRAAAARAAV